MRRTIVIAAWMTVAQPSLGQEQALRFASGYPDVQWTDGRWDLASFDRDSHDGVWGVTIIRYTPTHDTVITKAAGVGSTVGTTGCLPPFGCMNWYLQAWGADPPTYPTAEDAFVADPLEGNVLAYQDVVTSIPEPFGEHANGWQAYYMTYSLPAPSPVTLLASTDYILAILPEVPTATEWAWNESVYPHGLPPDPLMTFSSYPQFLIFGTAGFDLYGCPMTAGDLNFDCCIDLADFAIFAGCMGGPGATTPPPGCDPADFAAADLEGADNDVDMHDFAAFQTAFTGPAP